MPAPGSTCAAAPDSSSRALEAGYEPTGVDCSVHQLRHARRNAQNAHLVCADIRELALARRFDVITCMFDSLNYLTEPADLARALKRIAAHLTESGLFIFDVNTWEGLQDRWRAMSAFRDPGRLILVDSSFDEEAGLGHCLITGFLREGNLWRRFDEEHIQRGYRGAEIDAMPADAGLSFEKLDGHSLAEPGERCGRLLYVCEPR